MTDEIWKAVVGCEGSHEVSSLGRVRSIDREVGGRNLKGQILKLRLDRNGYPVAKIKADGQGSNKKVHRLMAIAFIPNSGNKPAVNHIDGIKTNNVVSNLEWTTVMENNTHARLTGLGLSPHGIDCKMAKLTNEVVQQAKDLHSQGQTYADIGRKFGVSYGTISRAVNGKTWKHLHKCG